MFEIDSAKLIGSGRIHADASWALPAHVHSHWEFVYFVRGTGRIDIPNETLRPQPYHLVVYPPGLFHSEISSPVDPEETVFFAANVPGDYPPGVHLLVPDPKGELGWLCQRIVTEHLEHGTSALATIYLQAFLHLLERHWHSGLPVEHSGVDLAVQHIHANYADEMTLATLAEAAHISPSHLAHRFRAQFGISPLRYLQRVRLEAAKCLLVTTPLSVSEIASLVGFLDPLYFSRAFRQDVGYCPTAYRKNANCAI